MDMLVPRIILVVWSLQQVVLHEVVSSFLDYWCLFVCLCVFQSTKENVFLCVWPFYSMLYG